MKIEKLNIKYASLILVILIKLSESVSLIVGHSHHNKRQQPQLIPTLTLDVEPHHGIEPSTSHAAAITDYYFPVGAGLFNFTCTIKHPSFKYKLTITKEQVFNNGEKSAALDMIDPSEYVLNPTIQDPRISVEFSEPSFLDSSARYLRVSLLIKTLKLEDNGIYTCKYSNINKKINTVVYKPANTSQITFPVTKVEKLQLNQPVTLTCRVNDVFPKPKVFFSHTNRKNLSDSTVEKDISNTKHNEYYLYSLSSTVTFTPSYLDNNEELACEVTSLHGARNDTVKKSLVLQVHGIQIMENECHESVVAKVGEQDFKLTCVYFSNPKLSTSQWETTGDEEKKTETEQPASDAEQSSTTQQEDQQSELIKLNDGDEIGNYHASVEKVEAPHSSGLYKAVLKLKEVRQQDFQKTFTIKLDKYERKIKLVLKEEEAQVQKGLPSVDQPEQVLPNSLTLKLVHSKSSVLFLISLSTFLIFFLSR